MQSTPARFAPRGDHDAIELGSGLAPKFDADGLITAVATDAATGEVLMVAHMNEEALARTIASREAWFFSRSRQKLWRKGEESGNTLSVGEMRVDCDQDVILLKVAMAWGGSNVSNLLIESIRSLSNSIGNDVKACREPVTPL